LKLEAPAHAKYLKYTSAVATLINVLLELMMVMSPPLLSVVLTAVLLVHHVQGFAAGKGFGASSSSGNKNFIGGDRFKSVCPADPTTIKQFDSALISDDADGSSDNNDTWVAVYRSKNNLPVSFTQMHIFDLQHFSLFKHLLHNTIFTLYIIYTRAYSFAIAFLMQWLLRPQHKVEIHRH
jgi:hypothetical protein